MKYEFHVGDYVETKSGSIGFVSSALTDGLTCWTPTKLSEDDIRRDVYDVGDVYSISVSDERFKRIGQYDFAKPEQPKEIERLPESWMDTPAYRKINELVNAVNELRKERK